MSRTDHCPLCQGGGLVPVWDAHATRRRTPAHRASAPCAAAPAVLRARSISQTRELTVTHGQAYMPCDLGTGMSRRGTRRTPNRKSDLGWARGSTRRSVAEPGSGGGIVRRRSPLGVGLSCRAPPLEVPEPRRSSRTERLRGSTVDFLAWSRNGLATVVVCSPESNTARQVPSPSTRTAAAQTPRNRAARPALSSPAS